MRYGAIGPVDETVSVVVDYHLPVAEISVLQSLGYRVLR